MHPLAGEGRVLLAPPHLQRVRGSQCWGRMVQGPYGGGVPEAATSPLPAAGGARFPRGRRYSKAVSLSEYTGSIQLLLKSPKRAGIFLDLLLNKSSPLLLARVKHGKMLGVWGKSCTERGVQLWGVA